MLFPVSPGAARLAGLQKRPPMPTRAPPLPPPRAPPPADPPPPAAPEPASPESASQWHQLAPAWRNLASPASLPAGRVKIMPQTPLPLARSRRDLLLAWAALAVVYLVWGSTYLAIRVGDRGMPPAILAGVRYLVAGAILRPIALRIRSHTATPQTTTPHTATPQTATPQTTTPTKNPP